MSQNFFINEGLALSPLKGLKIWPVLSPGSDIKDMTVHQIVAVTQRFLVEMKFRLYPLSTDVNPWMINLISSVSFCHNVEK